MDDLERTLGQLRKRERQAAVLAELGHTALITDDLQRLFDQAVSQVAEALNNPLCKILQLREGGDELLLVAGVGWKKGLAGKATVGTGLDSQAGYTLQSDGPVLVRDLRNEQRFSGPSLLVDHGVISGMSVVIGPRRRPWGVLGTHSTEAREFTSEDAYFIQAVANTLWDAIARQQTERDLRERAAWLAGQRAALEAAMDGEPLETSLGVLARTATEALGATTRAAFYLADGERAGLRHVVGMGAGYAEAIDGVRIGPESLACDLTTHAGKPALTGDVMTDERWKPWRWLAESFGYRGCWSFPIHTSAGRFVGTFAIYSREPREATERDLELAALLSHTAAMIIAQHKESMGRKEAEAALRESEQRLREADRAKDEFLAVLGHELRNPLAPIRTGLDLLEQASDDARLVDSVRPMLNRQVTHLVRLVDDLLDISRVSRGKITLHSGPLDLSAPVRAALEQTKPFIAERQHQLIMNMSDASLPVHGDLARLTQVVSNLLSNAAKYTEAGGTITVTTELDEGHATLRVRDTGFGVPPDRVDKLFKLFSQIPEHQSRVGAGGLGIGLALSRQLVAMHGGRIELQSEGLGQGSEFIVRLPLREAVAGVSPVEDQGQEAGAARRVLIVDDNIDAAESLRLLLEREGHAVEVAHEGPNALREVEAFQPEVLLLDLGLPGMDGIEVAKQARATNRGQDLLLIAVTGRGQEEDKTRTRDAGFDHHLTKPVDTAALRRLLHSAA